MLKPPAPKSICYFYDCSVVPYAEALRWQENLVKQRRNNPELADVLILLEHLPVYTLGKGSSLEFIKFDPHQSDVEVHTIARGGEVTYHCLGQLVGYPILNLQRHQPDLHWYLRQLEEMLIRVLAHYHLPGERLKGLTGVWVKGRKVAAIGIKVSRWITMHGFALNVNPNLQGFQKIIPCGISDRPVGSLAEFIPDIELSEVRQVVARSFTEIFDLELMTLNETTLKCS